MPMPNSETNSTGLARELARSLHRIRKQTRAPALPHNAPDHRRDLGGVLRLRERQRAARHSCTVEPLHELIVLAHAMSASGLAVNISVCPSCDWCPSTAA